jgi:uncharacterized membrane protein
VAQSSRISARGLSLVVLALAILISGYLSYLKINNATAVCIEGGAFDCGTVLNSRYSELAGIPIAWLGLATNLIVTALLLLEPRVGFLHKNGPMLVFGIVLFAFLFSVFLVYVQAAIIRAFCPWCLTHEALITILFGLSIWRLRGVFNTEATESALERQ